MAPHSSTLAWKIPWTEEPGGLHLVSQVVPVVKNLPASAGDTGLIPGSEDPLEKEMATHSSVLAWETPGTEEPGGLQFMGLQSQTRFSD